MHLKIDFISTVVCQNNQNTEHGQGPLGRCHRPRNQTKSCVRPACVQPVWGGYAGKSLGQDLSRISAPSFGFTTLGQLLEWFDSQCPYLQSSDINTYFTGFNRQRIISCTLEVFKNINSPLLSSLLCFLLCDIRGLSRSLLS